MNDVDRERELISDADLTRVHGFANFGAMTPRDVIRDGVVKYAMGYTGGHTQLSILIEHALIHKPKPGSYQSTLTKKGRAYLRAIMPTWGVLTALRAALDRAEADKAAADARRQNAEAAYNDGWSFAFRQWERTGSVPPPPQRALSPPPAARGQDVDALVEAALHARIPGGSEAWVWIMPQTDAFAPSEHQRDIARCMVKAALAPFTGGGK
jgi:hypothetical protein